MKLIFTATFKKIVISFSYFWTNDAILFSFVILNALSQCHSLFYDWNHHLTPAGLDGAVTPVEEKGDLLIK